MTTENWLPKADVEQSYYERLKKSLQDIVMPLWEDFPLNPDYWRSPREKALKGEETQTGVIHGGLRSPTGTETPIEERFKWIPQANTRERVSPGEKFIGEWVMPATALSWIPSAMTGWRAAGKLPAVAKVAARTALAPAAAAEKALELPFKAAEKVISPIRALVKRKLELPEKTITHTYEQLTQAHKLARQKNLLNRKTGQPTKNYRNLAEIYTGKTSVKDMTRDESDRFITALGQLQVEGRKPPKIPKITTPMVKEFWDSIPLLKDVGFVDYLRQKPKVLQMLGMDDFADDLIKHEVASLEEKGVFLNELVVLKKLLGKGTERGARIFDSLEEPIKSHLLDPDEQKVYLFARKFFDKWADDLKIPLDKRKINYITHIFDQQLRKDAGQNKTLPLEILKAMEFNYPRQTYMPFLKERLGATVGLKRDPFAAMEVYESYALRQKYYQPLLQKLSAYITMFEARGKLTAANYLKDMARRIGGRPSKEDILINQSMSDFVKGISKIPGIKSIGGLQLENLLNRGNLGAVIAHNFASVYYMAWLGFRPVSAIRNLSQQLLAVADAGVINFSKGIGLKFTQQGKNALKQSVVLRSRLAGEPVAGLEESTLMKLPQRLQQVTLAMFKGADKENVSNSFLAGYAQGKALDLPEKWAIQLGDEVATNTQFLYTKMARSLFEDTILGRFLTPFTSWPRNFMELFTTWVQGRTSLVLQDYMKETGKQLAIPKRDIKPLLTYAAMVIGAYVTEGLTALKATEYTGWTSVKNLGQLLGGDIPSLQIIRGLGLLAGGAFSGDERMIKEGWSEVRPDKFVMIIKQLEDIAEGKQDILSLFMYLDREEMKREDESRNRTRTRPTRTRPERSRR